MYWAKEIAKQIISKKGKKLTLATGITPSGHIHIGNMREVMTAELIRAELVKLGAEVRFIYIADDFDRLRKLYPFLPKEFEKYIGWPLANIPDPQGEKNKSYSKHFLEPFFEALDQIGIKVEKLFAKKMYEEGFYTDSITTSLKKKNEIKEILEKISGREIPTDWSPFNPLCKKCGKIDEAKIIEEDLKNTKVKYKCTCGNTDWADYSKGEGKLSWRIDWPAKWSQIPVDVEPYGKEHATVGGSYDTGKAICEQVFETPAPYGIGYDLLYLKGFKGKMSSSLGNVISAQEFLEIVPPEILKYMFVKTKYDKPIYFDPQIGFMQLVDEYSKLEELNKTASVSEDEKLIYEACQINQNGKIISIVPFKHLLNAVQASCGSFSEVIRILKQTGYTETVKDENQLKIQIKKINNWLEKYAPENMKFSIQKELPEVKISDSQKKLLLQIAQRLEEANWDAEKLHNHIYELGKNLGLKPKETFEPIYLSLLGKSSGPKAGWFLAVLDKDFVIKRFRDM